MKKIFNPASGIITGILCMLVPAAGVFCQLPATRSAAAIDSLRAHIVHPSAQHVLVVAHRADWRNFPENSLEGIRSALAMGVDIIETDVQQTKDGYFIVMHDKTVDRTTDGTGRVKDLLLSEIRQLHLKNAYGTITRYRVPLLEEVLAEVKGRSLVFLDKAYKYLAAIYPLLEKTGTTREALFEGKETIDAFTAEYGELVNKIWYMPRLNAEATDEAATRYLEEYLQHPALVAFFLLDFKMADAGSECLQKLRSRNVSVQVNALWPESCAGHDDDLSADDPAAGWGWLIDQGANLVCTDRPALLLQYLRKRQLHD
jgi:glycerophosphoryl diester phosphodiesterase